MDENSPANVELIAKGKNGDGSGAEMIYYTSESGGEVFSVGSINYPSSLNVDPRLSQITKNVFDRFLKD